MRCHQIRRVGVIQGDIDHKGIRRRLLGQLVCRAASVMLTVKASLIRTAGGPGNAGRCSTQLWPLKRGTLL